MSLGRVTKRLHRTFSSSDNSEFHRCFIQILLVGSVYCTEGIDKHTRYYNNKTECGVAWLEIPDANITARLPHWLKMKRVEAGDSL